MAVCRATIYLSFGLLFVLSIMLQTAATKFTRMNAVQYIAIMAVFYIIYIAALPLTFNAFGDICGAIP